MPQLGAYPIYDVSILNYDRSMFIVQATDAWPKKVAEFFKKVQCADD